MCKAEFPCMFCGILGECGACITWTVEGRDLCQIWGKANLQEKNVK